MRAVELCSSAQGFLFSTNEKRVLGANVINNASNVGFLNNARSAVYVTG